MLFFKKTQTELLKMKHRMSEMKTLTQTQSSSLTPSSPTWAARACKTAPWGWYRARPWTNCFLDLLTCQRVPGQLPVLLPQEFLQVFTIHHRPLLPLIKWCVDGFTEKMEAIWQETLRCSFLLTSGYHLSPPSPQNTHPWSLRTWSTHDPLSSIFQTQPQFWHFSLSLWIWDVSTYLKIIFPRLRVSLLLSYTVQLLKEQWV